MGITSPATAKVLTWGNVHGFIIWNASSGKPLQSFLPTLRPSLVAVSPCGSSILIAADGLSVWDVRTGTQTLAAPLHVFEEARLSRGGACIFASGVRDITVLDGATGETIRTFSVPRRIVDFAIDPDGRRVFAFSEDLGGTLDQVWDVETGELLHRLEGRMTGDISALAVSAAGDVVATCVQSEVADEWLDNDGFVDTTLVTQVRVWHAASGRPLHTFLEERSDEAFCMQACSITLSSIVELVW